MNLIIFIVSIGFIYCLEVIPERCEVSSFNPKYIKYMNCQVKRYGRTSAYYVNVNFYVYHTLDNNVTLDILFNEYLHNEYRRSFIEFHYTGCAGFMKNDIYISQALRNAGLKCPVPPGEQVLANITVPTQNFPNVFPFRRGRVDVILSAIETQQEILHTSYFLTFNQDLRKKT